jgi:hypothetical protein
MRAVRRVLGIALFLVGLLFGLIVVSKLGEDASVSRIVANNHVIHAHLLETASYVREFLRVHGRLPNQDDAERWKREAPQAPMRGATWWSAGPFDHAVLEVFGGPPQSEVTPFVVSYWRGEWREYYASWKNATSLTFDANAYYILGSRAADFAVHLMLATVTLALAYFAWPKARPPHPNDA